jgi:hypothetical protein
LARDSRSWSAIVCCDAGGLLEDEFDWGRRLGGERLSLCHVAWIWETLIHVAMMSKSW